jgi:predicted NUDIX family NTP pyrophosphohydrolase
MLSYNNFILESDGHKLSGIVLIYNNKILLVRPKKFRRKMKKWSIPKGHVDERIGKIASALKELREESRIKLKKKQIKKYNKTILNYEKSGNVKELTCYIVEVEKDDINVKLINDMILSNFLKNEILEAGFFSKNDAKKIIEKYQLELLKFLD